MGSCINSRADGYLLGNGLCSRNNRTILRKEELKLGESPASFLSCNRTIVRTLVARICCEKKMQKDVDICSNQYYIIFIN